MAIKSNADWIAFQVAEEDINSHITSSIKPSKIRQC